MRAKKTPLTDAQPPQWIDDVMGPQEDRSTVSRKFAEELEQESEIRRLTIVTKDVRIGALEAELAKERARLAKLRKAVNEYIRCSVLDDQMSMTECEAASVALNEAMEEPQ